MQCPMTYARGSSANQLGHKKSYKGNASCLCVGAALVPDAMHSTAAPLCRLISCSVASFSTASPSVLRGHHAWWHNVKRQLQQCRNQPTCQDRHAPCQRGLTG